MARRSSPHYHRWLLAAAWCLFIVSLFSPGLHTSGFLSHNGEISVFEYLVVAFISLVTGGGVVFPHILLLGVLCFVATPFLARKKPSGRSARFARSMTVGLFLSAPWILLYVGYLVPSLAQGDLACGYYLFASAHSLAFAACLLAPLRPPKPRAEHGFPVVIPNETAEPPQPRAE